MKKRVYNSGFHESLVQNLDVIKDISGLCNESTQQIEEKMPESTLCPGYVVPHWGRNLPIIACAICGKICGKKCENFAPHRNFVDFAESVARCGHSLLVSAAIIIDSKVCFDARNPVSGLWVCSNPLIEPHLMITRKGVLNLRSGIPESLKNTMQIIFDTSDD